MKAPQQYKVTCRNGIVRQCQVDNLTVISRFDGIGTSLRVYIDVTTWQPVHVDDIISIERIPGPYEGVADGYYWTATAQGDEVARVNNGMISFCGDEDFLYLRDLPNETIKEIYVNEKITRHPPLAHHHGQHEAGE